MNAPKCCAEDYIDYLVASPCVASGTEAARTQPARAAPPAHDAYTRLLHRLEPDAGALWGEAEGLVARQWSGKHKRVVWGIGLVTLLWSDGEAPIPCDYRLYDKGATA